MENNLRIERANEIKAIVDRTKPVTAWGMTASVWTSPQAKDDKDKPRNVRVYVNDKKRQQAAVIVINEDGSLSAEWQKGHSLTRDELRAALGVQ
jgi:hypothetical protein